LIWFCHMKMKFTMKKKMLLLTTYCAICEMEFDNVDEARRVYNAYAARGRPPASSCRARLAMVSQSSESRTRAPRPAVRRHDQAS
jgi:hypothetical protein